MAKDAWDSQIVKVTLELRNGEVDVRDIGDNDGVICLAFSKEQDFRLSAGYCKDLETQTELLSELVEIVERFAKTIELQRWVNEHKN